MKKLFALMLVVTAMVISGCAKSEDATKAPAATGTEAAPAEEAAETPAEEPAK